MLWAAYTLSFLILFLLPGDAAAVQAGGADQGQPDPALLARLRSEYGLDRPLYEQYLLALGKALQLNFGTSAQSGGPALQAVADAFPQTLLLTSVALPLAIVTGVGLAILSTFVRARWLRQLLSALPPLGVSVPVFWVGLLLLQTFSFHLRLFPSMGNAGFGSLVLPAITLAIPVGAYLAQLLSRNLRTTLALPYIELVRARGASDARVHFRHALRNAVIPAVTILGILVGSLLSASVVTETVFSRTGVGRLTVTAVNNRDIPVVQAVVVLVAAIFVVTSLLVDLLYPLIDRRINFSRSAFVAS
ncbi:ABC transporter permease [soil metagenome]